MVTDTSGAVDAEQIEIWETQIPGTVWVYVRDRAQGGNVWKLQRVGGAGTQRIRVTREEREFTSEMVVEENRPDGDPFANGSLVQVVAGKRVGEWTDEILHELLTVKGEPFDEAVREIGSELTLRRLLDVALKEGTVPQVESIREVIEERYKVGGTQRTVREMIAAGELTGGEIVSEVV